MHLRQDTDKVPSTCADHSRLQTQAEDKGKSNNEQTPKVLTKLESKATDNVQIFYQEDTKRRGSGVWLLGI